MHQHHYEPLFQREPNGFIRRLVHTEYSSLRIVLWPAFTFELSYLPNPSARAGYDTRSIFKRSLTGLNSEFSFSLTSCLTKAEEPSRSYYLPIDGGRSIRFIPFPRVLVLCEMQSFSSRIWTRVAVFISYDDNHFTTGTSFRVIDTKYNLLCSRHPVYLCVLCALVEGHFHIRFTGGI